MHVGKSFAMTLRRLELWLNVVEKLLEKFKDFLYLALMRMAKDGKDLLINFQF